MISEGFLICTKASNKNNVDYDLLKSINDVIFKELVSWTRKPTSLRAEISKLGVWYFKKAKTSNKKDMFLNAIRNGTTKDNEDSMLNRIINFDFILSEYKKFNEDKYNIKCLKYGRENYEAYCLAKKQEKIQKAKENKSL